MTQRRLALSLAFFCCLSASVSAVGRPEPSLPRETAPEALVTWKRPVIIYNRAVGREQALRLKRRLQVLLDEEIGLYPCGKERSLEVPLPDDCTRIWLDSMYWYPKRGGHPDDYRVTIGDRRRTYRDPANKWETDAAVCMVGHGQASVDRAIDVLFEMLEPYVYQVGGQAKVATRAARSPRHRRRAVLGGKALIVDAGALCVRERIGGLTEGAACPVARRNPGQTIRRFR